MKFKFIYVLLSGTLTTVEGLLKALADGLSESVPFASGDSAAETSRLKVEAVCERLRLLQEGDSSVLPFRLVIDDPADMSFVALRGQQQQQQKGGAATVDASTHVDGDAARALAAAAAAAAKACGGTISEEGLKDKIQNAKGGEILWRAQLDESLVRHTDDDRLCGF